MTAPILDGAEPFHADGDRRGVLVIHGFTSDPRSMAPDHRRAGRGGLHRRRAPAAGPRHRGGGPHPDRLHRLAGHGPHRLPGPRRAVRRGRGGRAVDGRGADRLAGVGGGGPTPPEASPRSPPVPTAAEVSALPRPRPDRPADEEAAAGAGRRPDRQARQGRRASARTSTRTRTCSTTTPRRPTRCPPRPRPRSPCAPQGFTGKGVTVGVVDSGCDGTHPDIADHVVHNVTLLSPEYVNRGTRPHPRGPHRPGSLQQHRPRQRPRHPRGRHHRRRRHLRHGSLGVAPDAELACFAIGAVHHHHRRRDCLRLHARPSRRCSGIDVFNNSWGNSFRQYDPKRPGQRRHQGGHRQGRRRRVLRRELRRRERRGERQPVQPGPWVISVAAGHASSGARRLLLQRPRSSTTAQRAIGRAATPSSPATGSASPSPTSWRPGVDSRRRASHGHRHRRLPAGRERHRAHGTSMARPHIAGAAAVITQANPKLSPARVQHAMTATASAVWSSPTLLPL